MTDEVPTNTVLTTLLEAQPPAFPEHAHVMTALIEVPPGDPGSPPHRHSGPVFGYVTEGELDYEVEGRPARVVPAGESFWEPGGDVIHYRAANNLADRWTRFVAVMVCEPGEPMLAPVSADELQRRPPGCGGRED
jgi:quercetin dioxygenase-like cupin family protein